MSESEMLMSVFGGIITTILLAGVPWAYTIGNRLAHIEAKLANGIMERLNRHSDQLEELTVVKTKLEASGLLDHAERVLTKKRKSGGES